MVRHSQKSDVQWSIICKFAFIALNVFDNKYTKHPPPSPSGSKIVWVKTIVYIVFLNRGPIQSYGPGIFKFQECGEKINTERRISTFGYLLLRLNSIYIFSLDFFKLKRYMTWKH